MKTIYHIAAKRSGHAVVQRMIQAWLPHTTIVDCENRRPGRFRNVDGVFVLQVRDLLNWYASYLVHKAAVLGMSPDRMNLINTRAIIQRYWSIAQEYYWKTGYLLGRSVIRVSFDLFVKSGMYRSRIYEELNENFGIGQYSEDELHRVTKHGDGSSFDGRTYDGRAQEMSVLQRYKQIRPERYVQLFDRYPQLLEFYIRHMQPDEDKRTFLEEIGVLQNVKV